LCIQNAFRIELIELCFQTNPRSEPQAMTAAAGKGKGKGKGKSPFFVIPAEEEEGTSEEEEEVAGVMTEAAAAGAGAAAEASSVEAASSTGLGLGEELGEGVEFKEEGRGLSVERYRSKYRLLELRKDEAPVRLNEVRVTQKVSKSWRERHWRPVSDFTDEHTTGQGGLLRQVLPRAPRAAAHAVRGAQGHGASDRQGQSLYVC
jgi:hypothetical protein